jgi:hypothetical protein
VNPPISRRAPLRRTRPALPCLVGLALLLAALAPLAAARYAQGERVEITGIVSDPQGQPIEGVRVVLAASRNVFSLRELRRVDQDVRRVAATTDAAGSFTIEWPWDSYFNKFELLAGVPVRRTGGREDLQELARMDLTAKVLAGSPVVTALVIENRKFIDQLRAFLATVRSDDERRIYQEMGKPDRVRSVRYPDREESSWWYFESGRMYRFRDGKLEQVVPFEPVRGS